jgi:hypothetical protein
MILASLTSRFTDSIAARETLNTSPSLILNKDQHFLFLIGYPASRIAIPMIYARREEYRLGTAHPANHILQPSGNGEKTSPFERRTAEPGHPVFEGKRREEDGLHLTRD